MSADQATTDEVAQTTADKAVVPVDAVLAPPRLLVPVLSLRQEIVLRLLAMGWVCAGVWFWLWWLAPVRGDWSPGRLAATAGLAWLSCLGGYFTFFACRMTKPNPHAPVPELRVAMVVTKAPSEPWSVVQTTLEAMLAQDFPYAFDVWIADERPTIESLRWCFAHGVQVSSRNGEIDYHRASWPRRTKCKEGNLAWFYDTVGYERYDVVSQLDADHVPDADYLAAMVRPFADRGVGYVSAPSVCDANTSAGWTVRGRLHREAALHGPVQAGANGGWAPVCIGSHYAVRTQALKQVGGIGPDLAEDYTTTLWLQSGGWDGVFALDAVARGDGPESLGDMLVQEVQWARSLGAVLTRWAPGRVSGLKLRAGTRMGFALLFYALQSLFCVLGTLLPIYGVLAGVTWGNAAVLDFYIHLWACSLLLMAILAWLRRCQTLRPVSAPLWSWELVLFQLVRWPFVAGSFVQGMWAGLRRSDRPFRVTPKGELGRPAFTLRMLWPTVALAALPTTVVLAVPDSGNVLGLYLLVALQAVTYLIALTALVVLHVRACAAIVARDARRSGAVPMPAGHVRPGFARGVVGRFEVLVLLFVVTCATALAVQVTRVLSAF